MLLGLALIAVPLLVAILTAALQIRQLADTGQKIVVEGVTGARASQELFSQIASLERTARLYDVLDDSNLLELYHRQDARLTATRAQLETHVRAPAARKTLGELGQLQQAIGLSERSTGRRNVIKNETTLIHHRHKTGADTSERDQSDH